MSTQHQQQVGRIILAPNTQPQEGTKGRIQECLFFSSGPIQFGVLLSFLREIVTSPPKITPLPFSPSWLQGVFSLRGELVAAIDLATFLEIGEPNPGKGQFMVAEVNGQKFALVVDAVEEIFTINLDRIGKIEVGGKLGEYILGIFHTQQLVIFLDMQHLGQDILQERPLH